jgi:Leucine-rich repeat (LRR) protein
MQETQISLSVEITCRIKPTWMYQSNVTSVISQIFSTFPNLRDIFIHESGLRRIQSNAVIDATQLIRVTISENREMRTIFADAFSGAPNLENLQLADNAIEFIHPQAFSGLTHVALINLNGNNLRQLHENVLRQMPNLEMASFNWNFIEVIPSRLFFNNRKLRQAGFMDNQINAIGRSFLTPLFTDDMNWVFFGGNLCVDSALNFRQMNIDRMKDILRNCFENYDLVQSKLA